MALRTVEVPDCLQPPQPWWESTGMLPAAVLVTLVIVIAIVVVILVRSTP